MDRNRVRAERVEHEQVVGGVRLDGLDAADLVALADLERSRRITLEEWRTRPWTEKLWEHAMGLLSSQL